MHTCKLGFVDAIKHSKLRQELNIIFYLKSITYLISILSYLLYPNDYKNFLNQIHSENNDLFHGMNKK